MKIPEFVKTNHKPRLVGENIPNGETLSAIKEVERGKVKTYGSVTEMMIALKKKAGIGA